MYLEEDVQEYLNEQRYSLISVVYKILFFTFLPLLFLYLFNHLFLASPYSAYIVEIVSVTVLIIFLVRKVLLRKYLYLCTVILLFLFFSLAIFSSLTRGLLSPFPYLLLSICFAFSLISLNEKWAFLFVLLFLTFIYIFSLCDIEIIGVNYESEICLILKSMWLTFLLLFILYKGCVIMKMCNQKNSNYLEKYKIFANLEHRHRLIGKVSKCLMHDIATPLTVLSGSIKLLSEGNMNGKEYECVKESALKSLMYMEGVMDNSFNLINHSDTKEIFLPNTVLKGVLGMVKNRLEKDGIALSIKLLHKPKIFGNKSSFSRIFLNILMNSIEELELCRRRNKIIEIEGIVKDNQYILSIKDNGRGINEEIVKNIEDLELTSEKCNHLGLGLFFIYSCIKNDFKGEVNIKSRKGKYTKVIINIPLLSDSLYGL